MPKALDQPPPHLTGQKNAAQHPEVSGPAATVAINLRTSHLCFIGTGDDFSLSHSRTVAATAAESLSNPHLHSQSGRVPGKPESSEIQLPVAQHPPLQEVYRALFQANNSGAVTIAKEIAVSPMPACALGSGEASS